MLEQKIQNFEAKIAVVGLGYVGIPLLKAILKKGFSTIAIDHNLEKVNAIKIGKSYLNHMGFEGFKEACMQGHLDVSTSFDSIQNADVVIICVPTPLTKNKEPDLSFILAVFESIKPFQRKGQLFILESTTYPGTTDTIIPPLLEDEHLKLEKNIFLAFSPEREDPGNKDHNVVSIPKLIGGVGEQSAKLADLFYSQIVEKTHLLSNARTAEAAKLTENIFRSVNIALVNELKMIYEPLGIDIWEVIEAAKTKPFGYMPFYPGPGSGGHCIPIDPYYLSWQAKKYGKDAKLIELAGAVNASMPAYVVSRLEAALQRDLSAAKILILGLAYKKNIADLRESPALDVWKLLETQQGVVDFYDPHIDVFDHHKGLENLTAEILNAYDAVIIITDHDGVDYDLVQKNARLIIDTRNVCAKASHVFTA